MFEVYLISSDIKEQVQMQLAAVLKVADSDFCHAIYARKRNFITVVHSSENWEQFSNSLNHTQPHNNWILLNSEISYLNKSRLLDFTR